MKNKKEKVVCLFSGGLDSTTVLYYALSRGYEPYALSFDYGQRHKKELTFARKIVRKCGVEHKTVKISLPWGGSALTDSDIKVPKTGRIKTHSKIPITYVPARNIIFLSMASSWAEVIGATQIMIGANQLDYSGYPDCRGSFLKSFEKTVRVGTKAGVESNRMKIVAPLLNKTKKDIVLMAHKLGVPTELTWSCYVGGKKPCGKCESCLLRKRGFRNAHMKDN